MEAHGIFFSGLELGDTLRRKRISCFLLKKKQTNKKSKKKNAFHIGLGTRTRLPDVAHF